jgi:hypothetical protein
MSYKFVEGSHENVCFELTLLEADGYTCMHIGPGLDGHSFIAFTHKDDSPSTPIVQCFVPAGYELVPIKAGSTKAKGWKKWFTRT